jgi:NhaP-type Na+/H+ or K+/H+ antiporter
MYSVIFLVLGILLFVYLARILARRKGLDPVFWGVMGALFGPLALPFILLAKPGTPPSKKH